MKSYLVLSQAIIAVLVIQYPTSNEVDAKKPVQHWVNSDEKETNVQLTPNELAHEESASSSSKDYDAMGNMLHNIQKRSVKKAFASRRKELPSNADYLDMRDDQPEQVNDNDVEIEASVMTRQKNIQNETQDENSPDPVPKKKKIKKHKKKPKSHINSANERKPHRIRAPNDAENEYPSTDHTPTTKKKLIKKHKNKRLRAKKVKETQIIPTSVSAEVQEPTAAPKVIGKPSRKIRKKFFRKKFVKIPLIRETNASESDENMKKRQPVDIIVHIKMNE